MVRVRGRGRDRRRGVEGVLSGEEVGMVRVWSGGVRGGVVRWVGERRRMERGV